MEQQLNMPVRTGNCQQHGEYQESGIPYQHPLDDTQQVRWRGDCPPCLEERARRAKLEAAAEAKWKAERAERELQQRIRESGIPGDFRKARLDCAPGDDGLKPYVATNAGQKHALTVATAYVADFNEHAYSGRNLLFIGKPGCGKTHLAVAIGMALLHGGATVRYTTAYDMVRRFTDTWGRRGGETESSILADLANADLLIIDEAGAQSGSDVELRTIFNVIDARYREGFPTLMLSNLSVKQLTPYVGERVIDRLRDKGSELVAFDWASHRGNGGMRNAA